MGVTYKYFGAPDRALGNRRTIERALPCYGSTAEIARTIAAIAPPPGG